MDTVDFPRFILAFVFVLGLIGLLAVLLKRYGNPQKYFSMKDDGSRVRVVEVRYLDPKRRIVLLRRDAVEHLILLGEGRELLLESGIVPPPPENLSVSDIGDHE